MRALTERVPPWASLAVALVLGALVGAVVALGYDGPYELAPVAVGAAITAGAERVR